jgi:two-component sensor histidine kinase
MMIPTFATALLEALSEPVLLVADDGTILHANRAAAALVGERLTGQPVSTLHVGDAGALHAYLKRCLGSRQPLVGALELVGEAGSRKLQCRGSLVIAEGDRAILLRLSRMDEERFTALARKVEELGMELRERQRARALLEETLRERELLLRELEHRVKNNMHMLAAMLMGAEREATSEEAKAALRDASLRFSAVSAVQQLLYNSENLESIGSEALVATLLRAALSIAPGETETEVAIDQVDLPIDAAVPIALMLNELLTNAIKYGRLPEHRQKVKVEFLQKGQRIEIAVQDNGPGFDLRECRKRASGLGLVRGLLRQLGGSLAVEQHGGSRCTLSFTDPRCKSVRSAA